MLNSLQTPSHQDIRVAGDVGNSSLSFAKAVKLMLWVYWRTKLAQIRGVSQKSPLLLFVLVSFILGYFALGFWIFLKGFSYLQQFPLVGALLSQRVMFLIFSSFFVMLIFSNLIIGYSTLFKNRETTWMLTLPMRYQDVYRWKFFESLVVSSWALMFLSAPMMLAYGQVYHVPWVFYVQVAVAYIPFVIIPALIGSWGILALVHFLSKPWAKSVLISLSVALLAFIIFALKPVDDLQAAVAQDVVTFDKLLQGTRFVQHPLLPSAWLAQTVLAFSDELDRKGTFFLFVLISNALMGLTIGFGLIDRLFYGSWVTALNSRAERFHHAAERKRSKIEHVPLWERLVQSIPFVSISMKALMLKDIRLFWRDPSQWTQFMIFFGLLCIYVVNLRNVSFSFRSPFWEVLISHMNLAASALTLSTLTTRFVFPQFSLEGRRLWIIGLAPIGVQKVLLQKFWSSFLICGCLITLLMVFGCQVLNMSWERTVFFCSCIILLSATLSGLAVGSGALFPNLKEDNPSKIVSGFGGTLCLLVSFVYIVFFVCLTALPSLQKVSPLRVPIPDAWLYGIALVMSLFLLFVPMSMALRRVKSLEF
jgi:ABC-2 type transport system permease protein